MKKIEEDQLIHPTVEKDLEKKQGRDIEIMKEQSLKIKNPNKTKTQPNLKENKKIQKSTPMNWKRWHRIYSKLNKGLSNFPKNCTDFLKLPRKEEIED